MSTPAATTLHAAAAAARAGGDAPPREAFAPAGDALRRHALLEQVAVQVRLQEDWLSGQIRTLQPPR
jgi:hypothetical protein